MLPRMCRKKITKFSLYHLVVDISHCLTKHQCQSIYYTKEKKSGLQRQNTRIKIQNSNQKCGLIFYVQFLCFTVLYTWETHIFCVFHSMQGSEPSSCLSFFCIFEKSGKNKATDLAVRGSTIAIISAMDKASTYRPVLARARVQVI